jgi:hypothetical protein
MWPTLGRTKPHSAHAQRRLSTGCQTSPDSTRQCHSANHLDSPAADVHGAADLHPPRRARLPNRCFKKAPCCRCKGASLVLCDTAILCPLTLSVMTSQCGPACSTCTRSTLLRQTKPITTNTGGSYPPLLSLHQTGWGYCFYHTQAKFAVLPLSVMTSQCGPACSTCTRSTLLRQTKPIFTNTGGSSPPLLSLHQTGWGILLLPAVLCCFKTKQTPSMPALQFMGPSHFDRLN